MLLTFYFCDIVLSDCLLFCKSNFLKHVCLHHWRPVSPSRLSSRGWQQHKSSVIPFPAPFPRIQCLSCQLSALQFSSDPFCWRSPLIPFPSIFFSYALHIVIFTVQTILKYVTLSIFNRSTVTPKPFMHFITFSTPSWYTIGIIFSVFFYCVYYLIRGKQVKKYIQLTLMRQTESSPKSLLTMSGLFSQ